ncbi:MAG: pyridoxine 5'-phosphate synthase [Thalassobaculaceae bacterium]
MTVLSVNLNKVALLRNQRNLPYPSVTGFAEIAIAAGAAGITVHPRPDERHIRRQDVHDLATLLARPDYAHIEFNIEGYPEERFLTLCETVRPSQVTLVPDAPDQRTSDHGWDFAADGAMLRDVIARLAATGSRTALFVDPDPAVIAGAAASGTDRVEIYTEPYAAAHAAGAAGPILADMVTLAAAAKTAGIGVNAGHDLSLDNLTDLVAAVPGILEVSIGHALTADALQLGFAAAVTAYRAALDGA